jgi:hypothetical protein
MIPKISMFEAIQKIRCPDAPGLLRFTHNDGGRDCAEFPARLSGRAFGAAPHDELGDGRSAGGDTDLLGPCRQAMARPRAPVPCPSLPPAPER